MSEKGAKAIIQAEPEGTLAGARTMTWRAEMPHGIRKKGIEKPTLTAVPGGPVGHDAYDADLEDGTVTITIRDIDPQDQGFFAFETEIEGGHVYGIVALDDESPLPPVIAFSFGEVDPLTPQHDPTTGLIPVTRSTPTKGGLTSF